MVWTMRTTYMQLAATMQDLICLSTILNCFHAQLKDDNIEADSMTNLLLSLVLVHDSNVQCFKKKSYKDDKVQDD